MAYHNPYVTGWHIISYIYIYINHGPPKPTFFEVLMVNNLVLDGQNLYLSWFWGPMEYIHQIIRVNWSKCSFLAGPFTVVLKLPLFGPSPGFAPMPASMAKAETRNLGPRKGRKGYLPLRKLAWNLKMMAFSRNLLFQRFIFRFYVSFRGCNPLKRVTFSTHHPPKKGSTD